MTLDNIVNEADFQRHFNGCQRRLTDLNKCLQTLEKSSLVTDRLSDVFSQIQFLYASLTTLDQSAFATNGKKRLERFKRDLEKARIEFERIEQNLRTKHGDESPSTDLQSTTNEEQRMALIDQKLAEQQQIELDLIHQTGIVRRLENDFTDIQSTFIDLNRMVREQGTFIDSIEQSLTTTDQVIEEGKENLKASVQVKQRSGRLKWILFAVLSCFLLLVVIIVLVALRLASPVGW